MYIDADTPSQIFSNYMTSQAIKLQRCQIFKYKPPVKWQQHAAQCTVHKHWEIIQLCETFILFISVYFILCMILLFKSYSYLV